MTTLTLRDEFRKDPALPILLGDEVFVRAIRKGVEEGVYVYRSGTLLLWSRRSQRGYWDRRRFRGLNDGLCAKLHNIWPRPKRSRGIGAGSGGGGGTTGGGGVTGGGGATTGAATMVARGTTGDGKETGGDGTAITIL